MLKRTRSLFIALVVIAMACTAFAQSVNTTTGSIHGVITDNTGAALPGVTVTGTNVDTGLSRNETTGSDGQYLLALLPPGRYRVEAELAGLGKAAQPNVTVLLGNATTVDLKVTPQVSEQITVTAAAPVVDTTRSGTATSVTNQQIENLPILGRDFRSLASLTPGIVGAFNSTITANGARGLSTDYNIDGANSTNDFYGQQTGGTKAPFTFSQAAIKEFQVIRSQYDAEYGRGVGATINAITKSGTNDIDGEAFYFLRKNDWASKRPLTLPGANGTTQTVSESFRSKDSSQPGFAVGGPIIHDQLFYFVNADFQRQTLPVIVGGDLRSFTGSGTFGALTADQQAQLLAKIQAVTGASYESGLAYDQTFNQNTFLAKMDWNAGTKNHFSLRDNYLKFTNENSQGATVLGLNQTTEIDKFNQLVLEGETIFTNNLYNQLIAQIAHDQRPVTPQYGGAEVSLTYGTGNGTRSQFFGLNDTSPSTADEKKQQIKDSLQWVTGTNTLKVGAEYLHRDLFDAFPRYVNGLYSFNSLTAFLNNQPNTFRQAYGPENGDVAWKTNLYSGYVNDNFRLGSRWTFDAGLRYDVENTPVPPTNAFPQHPEFVNQIKNDTNNYAPRFGFAFDVFGNGKSVLRGGIGKFFSYQPDILLAQPIQSISGALITTSFTCTTTATNPCPAYPNLLTPTAFLAASKLSSDIVTIGPDYQAQEAWRESLQFEQQLGTTYSVGIGGIYSHLTHVQGSRNLNLVYSGTTLGNLPIYNLNDANRKYADMGVVREIFSGEEGWYRGGTLEFHKLAVNNSNLSWDLSYTFSNSYDQETNERSTSTTFIYDPNNPSLSEGLSDNDVRHRVVGDVTYRLPWGFQVSAIGFWHSGVPYTGGIAFTGSGTTATSLSGQSQTTGNIPVFADASGNIIDLTQANGFTRAQLATFLAGSHIIGRNTFRQPDVWDADVRLAKFFNISHGMQLEVLAEVFNIFNTKVRTVGSTNINAFTTTYTASTDKYTFTKNANFGLVSGYSAEVDPRQLQVAAKIIF